MVPDDFFMTPDLMDKVEDVFKQLKRLPISQTSLLMTLNNRK